MQQSFSVNIPAESRTLRPDKNGKAQISYTVTNNKSNPARCRFHIVVKDGAKDEWFSFAGEQESGFGAEESQQIKVQVAIPPETADGTYGFRVDAVNVANPQEDFTEGDTIGIPWQAQEPGPKKPLPKWLIPTIAGIGVVIVLGVIVSVIPWGGSGKMTSRDTPDGALQFAYEAFEKENWGEYFDCLSPDLQDRVGAHALAHVAFGRPASARETNVKYNVLVALPNVADRYRVESIEGTFRPFVYPSSRTMIVKPNAAEFFADHGASHLSSEKLEQMPDDFSLMEWALDEFGRLGDRKRQFFEDAMRIVIRDQGADYKTNLSEFFLPILRSPTLIQQTSQRDDGDIHVASWSIQPDEPRENAIQFILERVGADWSIADFYSGFRVQLAPNRDNEKTQLDESGAWTVSELEPPIGIRPRKSLDLIRELDGLRSNLYAPR